MLWILFRKCLRSLHLSNPYLERYLLLQAQVKLIQQPHLHCVELITSH
ncbi:MAG: hypothetical protein V7L26_09995 [Nostoc sp.]